jgi:hypothetical protein
MKNILMVAFLTVAETAIPYFAFADMEGLGSAFAMGGAVYGFVSAVIVFAIAGVCWQYVKQAGFKKILVFDFLFGILLSIAIVLMLNIFGYFPTLTFILYFIVLPFGITYVVCLLLFIGILLRFNKEYSTTATVYFLLFSIVFIFTIFAFSLQSDNLLKSSGCRTNLSLNKFSLSSCLIERARSNYNKLESAEACNRVPFDEADRNNSRQVCYEEVAINKNDYTLCDQILEQDGIRRCYLVFMSSAEAHADPDEVRRVGGIPRTVTIDTNFCKRISSFAGMEPLDRCLSRIARAKLDPAFCSNMCGSSEQLNYCLSQVTSAVSIKISETSAQEVKKLSSLAGKVEIQNDGGYGYEPAFLSNLCKK